MPKLVFTDPTNHEKAVKLAYAMYGHISDAGIGGLPFADVVAALAMVGGMLLSGAYTNTKDAEAAAFGIANAMLERAKSLAGMPRESDARRDRRDLGIRVTDRRRRAGDPIEGDTRPDRASFFRERPRPECGRGSAVQAMAAAGNRDRHRAHRERTAIAGSMSLPACYPGRAALAC
jgi:hypothetical protein